MNERLYSAGDIAEICGISKKLVSNIGTRGYLTTASSEPNYGGKSKYKVVTKRNRIAPCFEKRGLKSCYNEKTLDAFLEATQASRERWPLASQIEQEIGKTAYSYIVQLWRKGMIRGRTSLGKCKVRIHPEDAELLRIDKEYSIRNAARRLGVSEGNIYDWNRAAKRLGKPFLRDSIGIRRKYVPPEIIERLERIKKQKGHVTVDSLKHLYDPKTEFSCYLNHTIVYNPDSPPSVRNCRVGRKIYRADLGVGKITGIDNSNGYRPTMEVCFNKGASESEVVILRLEK